MTEQPPEKPILMSDLFNREQSVHGDFAGGDKIVIGDLGGASGVAIGRGAQSSIQQQTPRLPDLVEMFRPIYLNIQLRPEQPGVGKDELEDLVHHIQEEVARGDQANSRRIERWLKQLEQSASDVFRQTVEVLANSSVASVSIHQLVFHFGRDTEKPAIPGADEIKLCLESAPWTPEKKTELIGELELIHNELQLGEKANLGEIAYALEQLIAADPGLRQLLETWLVDSDLTPRSVRIIAKKMLT